MSTTLYRVSCPLCGKVLQKVRSTDGYVKCDTCKKNFSSLVRSGMMVICDSDNVSEEQLEKIYRALEKTWC